jgi:hypothetical protein
LSGVITNASSRVGKNAQRSRRVGPMKVEITLQHNIVARIYLVRNITVKRESQ